MLTKLIPHIYLEDQDDSFSGVIKAIDETTQDLQAEISAFPLTTRGRSETRLVPEWLESYGNPFRSDLLSSGKQRLLTTLLNWAHNHRGSCPAIVFLAKQLLDLDVYLFLGVDQSWRLGKSALGEKTYLLGGEGTQVLEVVLEFPISDDQMKVLESIVAYMVPATFVYRIEIQEGGFGWTPFGDGSFDFE